MLKNFFCEILRILLKQDMRNHNHETKQLMTMHKVQDPKVNVDFYLLSNVMLEDVFALRIASTAPSTSSKLRKTQ